MKLCFLSVLRCNDEVLLLLEINSNIPLEDDGHNNSDADDDDLFPSPAPENWRALAQPPPPPGDVPIAPEDSDLDVGDDPFGIKEILSCQNTLQWGNIDLPSTPRPNRTHELPRSPPLRQSLYRDFQDLLNQINLPIVLINRKDLQACNLEGLVVLDSHHLHVKVIYMDNGIL